MEMKDRILFIRESSSLSQEAFAQRIGVTKSTISGYETGRREPSPQILLSISREFRYDLDWLKTGEGDPIPLNEDDALSDLFHIFSCSEFEKSFLEAYFDLQKDEREQFCFYLERIFGSAIEKVKEYRNKGHANPSNTNGYEFTMPDPKEMTAEELHAELDRQLKAQETAKEKSGAS
jgi:transcriptional regulator with XRE-family HTH domain